MATKTLHGYYRFTDIIFEWKRVIADLDDKAPLSAFLANESLVHPDNPLSRKDGGGIQLWIGTLPNGENRLLFTSAQIEYIRYWLHAMKLTSEPLPLPSSDYLIMEKDLVHASPCTYRSGRDLKLATRNLDKANKKLRGNNGHLNGKLLTFERARVAYSARRGTWLAVDFESWDREHAITKEFGYSFIQWKDGIEYTGHGHFNNKDYLSYRQTYVSDFHDKYNFGESLYLGSGDFKGKIRELVEELSEIQPLYLVFHDYKQDLADLKSQGGDVKDAVPVLPDTMPPTGKFIIDTTDLFGALEGENKKNHKRSLKDVCRFLDIDTKFLHNAGNDAYYTLQAAMAMLSGDPVDVQRDKRWPGKVQPAQPDGSGARVIFEPEQAQGSDVSEEEDLETIMGGYDPKTGYARGGNLNEELRPN